MFLHEPEPGAQPFDMFPRRGNPAPKILVFTLQEPDPLAGLGQFGTSVGHLAPARRRSQVLLRLLAAGAPGTEFLLDRPEQAFEPGELGVVRPCVG